MSNLENKIDWPKLASAVADQASNEAIATEVLSWLEANKGTRILVACSGGADSVCLLLLLWGLRTEWQLSIRVAHYNHGWRAEVSDADASFVADLCESLGCEFFTEKKPSEVLALTETSARVLRHDFLNACAEKSECLAIALGHQRNDIFETQLQRLARGAGLEGLTAPRAVHFFEKKPVHLRPLLELSSDSIRALLQSNAVPWREDASNQDQSIARNALRGEVIPKIAEVMNRDPNVGAARSQSLLKADLDFIETSAREQIPAAFDNSKELDRVLFKSLHLAIARRALTSWLSFQGLAEAFNASGFEQLLNGLCSSKSKGRYSAGSKFVEFDTTQIWVGCEPVIPKLEPILLKINASHTLSTGANLSTEIVSVDSKLLQKLSEGAVNPRYECYAAIQHSEFLISVREIKNGDYFQAMGSPGRRKLKDSLMDKGFGSVERKSLPVVILNENEIVWTPGLPVAESFRITPKTKQALKLTYAISETP